MKTTGSCFLTGLSLLALLPGWLSRARAQDAAPAIRFGENRRLPVPVDFSYAGYRRSESALPSIPARIVVQPSGQDDGVVIQAAIDRLASQPPGPDGFRGAVLLKPGRYNIPGQIRIQASGIVLRGSGETEQGTVLVAAGSDRRTLIEIEGRKYRRPRGERRYELAADIPVNSLALTLIDAAGLAAGDRIVIQRPSPQAWIDFMGMSGFRGSRPDERIDWEPGSRDIRFDRTVVAVRDHTVTLDAPLTCALERRFGGATIQRYEFPGRISKVGVENLLCISAADVSINPKNEEHSWIAVGLEAVEDAWVRNLATRHFAGSAVMILPEAKNITVADCSYCDPIAEDGGFRRRGFYTLGEMTLFLRCTSVRGRNDFVVGHCAPGPNAFVHCAAYETSGDSGPRESWATGVLFDNVVIDGGALALANRDAADSGAGWTAGNSVLYNCSASIVRCEHPPGAENWAFGCFGEHHGRAFVTEAQGGGEAMFLRPFDLFSTQLGKRIGSKAREILAASASFDLAAGGAVEFDASAALAQAAATAAPPKAAAALRVENGWLLLDGKYLGGGAAGGFVMWAGHLDPAGNKKKGVTRWVPGRKGRGFTDDLDEVTGEAPPLSLFEYSPSIWYERRRDDHQFVRRATADVVAPFYEYPWARSGTGRCWDGLSLYDLTRYNSWYFSRLVQLAELAGQKAQGLLNYQYLQHNILEAAAHYADYPWRRANCIQDNGLPEPAPTLVQSSNKKPRIWAAEFFYDVTHPVRRDLHERFIRHCLDVFAGHDNVIQAYANEYTGPLEFMRFWVDTIAAWRKEHGRSPLVALDATKDVVDAILSDPVRRPAVSVLILDKWWLQPDGTLYAPRGGEKLAAQHWASGAVEPPLEKLVQAGGVMLTPRQWVSVLRPRPPDPVSTYRTIREYADRYPDKAIFCGLPRGDSWLNLMAGASRERVRLPEELSREIRHLRPANLCADAAHHLTLAAPGRAYVIYALDAKPVTLDLAGDAGRYTVSNIDRASGVVTRTEITVRGGGAAAIPTSGAGAVVWLRKM